MIPIYEYNNWMVLIPTMADGKWRVWLGCSQVSSAEVCREDLRDWASLGTVLWLSYGTLEHTIRGIQILCR